MSDNVGGFVPVFEQRVAGLRKRLKDELSKHKSERSKHSIKSAIREIKSWEKTIKQHKKSATCPHCGQII